MEAIETELELNPEPNLHFIYFNLPIIGRIWNWGFGLMQVHYYLWQIQAYLVGRRLHHQIGFDLVHHVTFVQYARPSFLALLPIPFLWGPVGGGECAPDSFWQDFSFKNKLHASARLVARWVFESDPFVRLTARRSAVVRATTPDTAIRVRRLGATDVQIYSESGLSNSDIANLAKWHILVPDSIRFVSCGRLLYWKGFHLGLKAFAQAGLTDAEYWIFGDGPEKHKLQKLANQLGIAQQVKFWERIPRSDVLQKLSGATALIHPSLHDSGGWVCLEAMASRVPVVCLDLGGPAVQITEKTGFKITAQNPEQAIQDLATAMRQLALNPELRQQMGAAGYQRIKDEFNWTVKGRLLGEFYQEILQQVRSQIGQHLISQEVVAVVGDQQKS